MQRHNKGFTLIELLVVIAIIGILSSVVLTSLGSARSKGADAGIMSNLSTIRTQFEVDYDSTSGNPYGGPTTGTACADTVFASGIYKKAIEQSLNLSGGGKYCKVDATGWVVAVELKTSTTAARKYYCVDSGGNQVTKASLPSATACP